MEHLEAVIREQIEFCSGRISCLVEIGDWTYEHNANRIYSSASLIKIPILIDVFRQYERGVFDLAATISFKKDMIVGGSGVLQALDHSTWTIKDLVTLMIIVSDNTATNHLIDLLGKDSIKNCIESLQLINTNFQRKMMDLNALERGRDNTTSASDIVRCLKWIDGNGFLSQESCQTAKSILQQQQFKGKIPALMDAEKIYVGSKTGELPGVEHDCAIVSCNEKTAYIAILIDQIPKGKNCSQMMQEIGKALYEEMIR
ncbi:serine hydrolase [Robertmurraya massiliosenegalensis]|uniref:serine hydrolase n=1 Tax=Robertmurraya TaxID=2837507 RepID=UPI0039A67612